MHPVRRLVAGAALVALLCSQVVAVTADDDRPGSIDQELDLMERTAAVSDGELAFIPADAAEGVHEHLNRILITGDSLDQGWVTLEQCHENIDAVPAAQILFKAGGVRGLEIASTKNIGRAWVEGHSVQLEQVAAQARLCIRGQTRALHRLGDGHYRLRNGPFMRRFLDGYFPIRVALRIDYPTERLRLVGQSPASQPGFAVSVRQHGIDVDATFEGRLVTCFDFCDLRAHGDCGGQITDC